MSDLIPTAPREPAVGVTVRLPGTSLDAHVSIKTKYQQRAIKDAAGEQRPPGWWRGYGSGPGLRRGRVGDKAGVQGRWFNPQ